jgi:hypothetical protein
MTARHLGHEFLTDVVEIHLSGPLATQANVQLWRSLVYALLEGASQALSIRRDDLDGTLYVYKSGEPTSLVLFDNVPGGAGHVKRVYEELASVFEAAYQRVNNECCGPETSCYECLRNACAITAINLTMTSYKEGWCAIFSRTLCNPFRNS